MLTAPQLLCCITIMESAYPLEMLGLFSFKSRMFYVFSLGRVRSVFGGFLLWCWELNLVLMNAGQVSRCGAWPLALGLHFPPVIGRIKFQPSWSPLWFLPALWRHCAFPPTVCAVPFHPHTCSLVRASPNPSPQRTHHRQASRRLPWQPLLTPLSLRRSCVSSCWELE